MKNISILAFFLIIGVVLNSEVLFASDIEA